MQQVRMVLIRLRHFLLAGHITRGSSVAFGHLVWNVYQGARNAVEHQVRPPDLVSIAADAVAEVVLRGPASWGVPHPFQDLLCWSGTWAGCV